jgi:hypothetical protein
MTTSLLLRYLVGIVTSCYLSATAAIICFFAFGTTSTTLATAFVSVTPTACPQFRPSATRNSFQFVGGTIKNINKQTLQVVPQNPPARTKPSKTPLATTINIVYSNTTDITQQTLLTTSALQKGTDISIEAQLNSNKTYTALSITIQPNNQQYSNSGCFPGRGSRLGSPSRGPRPGSPSAGKQQTYSTSGGDQTFNLSCFAKKQAQKAGPTYSPTPPAHLQNICRAEGTIQSFKGNTLTIIDRQKTSHTILLTSGTNGTKILRIAPATASALKVGVHITAMGPTNKGTMTASRITIGTLGSSIE